MKDFKVNCTFIDNGTKRAGVMVVKANSVQDADSKIMAELKKLGATNITLVSTSEA